LPIIKMWKLKAGLDLTMLAHSLC